MLRVAAVVLALAVSFDFVMLDGKYTNAARQMAITVFRSFVH
jgi:hypothetical protein